MLSVYAGVACETMHHRGSNFQVLRCMSSLLSCCCFLLAFFFFVFSSFCCVVAIFFWVVSDNFSFFFAAINRRPYDCMRSAGEDGGLERVFINRLTNTN